MTIRITWARAAIALAALAAAGMLFAWSGIFNVAASTGHWRITGWFLHWTMRNSVRTHAAFATPDHPVARTGLVSAAGHFAQACAVCHGAPGQRPSPTMQAATPPAPNLSVNARQWTDRQLFWILQHGVKYSGMPAWAAQDRPDEVRRMVAFVRRLPDMSAAEYRALTRVGDGADSCAACHGEDGRGRGQPDIPVLGGQDEGYLLAALRGYAGGRRHSAVMQTAAAPLDGGQMRALARYYARMPGLGTAPVDAGPATTIVRNGRPAAQLPACASCHAPGRPYPILAGQKASYIAQRLRQWRGDPAVVDARKSHATMPVIARRIPEDMIEPLARFYAADAR